jgi:hypothetical protein
MPPPSQLSALPQQSNAAAAEPCVNRILVLEPLLPQNKEHGLSYLSYADRRHAVLLVLLASSRVPIVYDSCLPSWSEFAAQSEEARY